MNRIGPFGCTHQNAQTTVIECFSVIMCSMRFRSEISSCKYNSL